MFLLLLWVVCFTICLHGLFADVNWWVFLSMCSIKSIALFSGLCLLFVLLREFFFSCQCVCGFAITKICRFVCTELKKLQLIAIMTIVVRVSCALLHDCLCFTFLLSIQPTKFKTVFGLTLWQFLIDWLIDCGRQYSSLDIRFYLLAVSGNLDFAFTLSLSVGGRGAKKLKQMHILPYSFALAHFLIFMQSYEGIPKPPLSFNKT